MKKLTLKERQEALSNWYVDVSDKIYHIVESNRPQMVFRSSYLKDGETYTHVYCEKCGAEYDEPHTTKRTSNERCNHCDNQTTIHTAENNSDNIYIEENENGWTAAAYSASFEKNTTANPDEPFAWMKAPAEIIVNVGQVIRYDKEYGFMALGRRYYWYGEMKHIREGTVAFDRTVAQFERVAKHLPQQTIMAKIKAGIAEQAKQKEEKLSTGKTKAQMEEAMRVNYEPEEIDQKKLLDCITDTLYTRYTDIGATSVYKMACLKCNHIFESVLDSEVVCPRCGQVHPIVGRYSMESRRYHLFVFENTNLPDEDLLLRIFSATCRLKRNPTGEYAIERAIHEETRFFFGKKKHAYDVKSGITKIRADMGDYQYSTHYTPKITVNSKDELKEIISNSHLRYSGAIEAMGLGNPAYKPICTMNDLAYIKAWYANKSIEYIYKAQLEKLTLECMNYSIPQLNKGTSVKEILGLTNLGLQIVRQCDLGIDEMCAVRTLCKHDPTLTIDGYRELRTVINPVEAAELAETYGVRWKEMVDYIDSVYMHQCIEKEEAVSVWRDYLNMARSLGYNLSEKNRRFPTSLRKEHDIVTFAQKAIQYDIDKQEFAEQAKKNHEKYYYTYEKLMAVIPETTEAIIEEATNQHNCLRSYINSIKNGSTAVAFIRYKDAPDTTYVTVEVRGSQILQIKGFANSNPRNAELTEFLKHWTKAKKLQISCTY